MTSIAKWQSKLSALPSQAVYPAEQSLVVRASEIGEGELPVGYQFARPAVSMLFYNLTKDSYSPEK